MEVPAKRHTLMDVNTYTPVLHTPMNMDMPAQNRIHDTAKCTARKTKQTVQIRLRWRHGAAGLRFSLDSFIIRLRGNKLLDCSWKTNKQYGAYWRMQFKSKYKGLTVFECKRHQPNAVLGDVELLSCTRVIFFNCRVAVSVVGCVKNCHHPGGNPQHPHHWGKKKGVSLECLMDQDNEINHPSL